MLPDSAFLSFSFWSTMTVKRLLLCVIISSTFESRGSAKQHNIQTPVCYVNPVAVGTWSFSTLAVEKARELLEKGGSAVEAVEAGINVVELDTNGQYFVGYGGLPNSEGKMELDAAIMEGKDRLYGAVMSCPGIKTPISVARKVMEQCEHNILVGEGALAFAKLQGFQEENVLLESSHQEYVAWKAHRSAGFDGEKQQEVFTGAPPPPKDCHDTIGLLCLDKDGNLAAGCSTSGWAFKLPGRVGDSPLIGSGLYCDNLAGAAVATGTGEEIMRSCLSFLVVEYMRSGLHPMEACQKGMDRLMDIVKKRPNFGQGMHTKLVAGVIALNKEGQVGAATSLGCQNQHRSKPAFPYVTWKENMQYNKHKFNIQGVSFDENKRQHLSLNSL